MTTEVTKAQMWIYGLPAIAREPVLVFIGIYSIVFYERLGASLAIIGFFIAVSRGIDICNDPLIAHLTDLTKTRWGRRYPWMMGSVMIFVVSLVWYWAPPDVEGIEAWFGVFFILLLIGYSLYFIPYGAIAPELTFDQETRQRLYAIQAILEAIAYIFLSFFPGVLVVIIKVVMDWGDSNSCELDAQRVGFATMAILLSIVFVISTFLVINKIKPNLDEVERSPEFAPALVKISRNYPFMLLLIPWLCERIAAQIIVFLLPFFIIYVLDPEQYCEDEGIDDSSAQCSPGLWIAIAIFNFFLAGLISTPIWNKLVYKYGKRRMWLIQSFCACFTLAPFLFLQPGMMATLVVFTFLGGIPWGGRFLNEIILADIIEYEDLITCRRAEAEFTMFQSFLPKMVGIPSQVLPIAGLVAVGFKSSEDGENQDQSDAVKYYLQFIWAGVPLVCQLIGALIKTQFPFRSAKQIDAIRYQIERRRNGEQNIIDPITKQKLVSHPQITPEVEKDYELCEIFQNSSQIQKLINGKYSELRRDIIIRLAICITITISLIAIAGATFEFLYDATLAWIPIISMVFIGLSSLSILYYGQSLQIMNRFKEHEISKEILEALWEYYDSGDSNRKFIRNRKHVNQVYNEGNFDVGLVSSDERSSLPNDTNNDLPINSDEEKLR